MNRMEILAGTLFSDGFDMNERPGNAGKSLRKERRLNVIEWFRFGSFGVFLLFQK
jgi:hypothetical protein